MTAPWPLLSDLDALLRRDGWMGDFDGVVAMELRIADETGIGRLHDEYLDALCIPMTLDDQVAIAAWKDTPAWKWPHPERSVGAPFLRSRDAAAMLEEAVFDSNPHLWTNHYTNRGGGLNFHIYEWQALKIRIRNVSEPAARTRAALEAGFRVGLWPARREP